MINKRSQWICKFFLSVCFLSVSWPLAHAETFIDVIESGGRERSFVVALPSKVRPGNPVPTVIALHGALMQGKSMRRIFGLDDLSEQDGFAVVYPNGLKRRWNDGRAEHRGGPDDVRFIRDLAGHLVRERIADPKRLYLLGVSNGGMLTYRMACEAPGLFAAYAAIIANVPVNVAENCRKDGYAPMLIINSTEDPIVPWEGGGIGYFGARGEVLSTDETVDFWLRYNRCSEKSQMKPLPDKDRTDGSTVEAQQYADCRSEGVVVLLTVDGGGHLPPGAQIGNRPLLQSMLGGPANRDISAADISWKFFKRFPL
jgi:polyhydroxybutyrate depolymerase